MEVRGSGDPPTETEDQRLLQEDLKNLTSLGVCHILCKSLQMRVCLSLKNYVGSCEVLICLLRNVEFLTDV